MGGGPAEPTRGAGAGAARLSLYRAAGGVTADAGAQVGAGAELPTANRPRAALPDVQYLQTHLEDGVL